MSRELWIAFGFFGQLMFTLRFLIQWITSERHKRSVTPIAFWWFSLAGGAILLWYAIHLRDPVFILGQGAGLFIYARNLQLIRNARSAGAPPPGPASPA